MADAPETPENLMAPLHVFRFAVHFYADASDPPAEKEKTRGQVLLCSGAFSECTGLEATMEPRVIKAGGVNYGAAQRVGRISFATVVLKRGMTVTRDLWTWFQLVAGGASAVRLTAEVEMQDGNGTPVVTWRLKRTLPVKFKAADLNARGTEVGIEELHLVHEGLELVGGAGNGNA